MDSGDDGFSGTVGGAPASCDFTAVVYTAGEYSSENNFTISDCDGAILAEMTSGVNGFDDCLDLGDNYIVTLNDTWGDSWNGGSLSIGGVAYTIDGVNDDGSDAITIIGSCGVTGCDDMNATNYDDAVTINDGSCTYDCPLVGS